MKLNNRPTRKGFTLVELLVVMSIIAVLASIATPLLLSKSREADKSKATLHAKQIQIAMLEFTQEYGIRPGEQIAQEKAVPGAAASSSNDIFRQLLQGLPTVNSEAIFFAPSKISKKPDNDVGDKDNEFKEACEEGEVGFLYMDNPKSRDGAPLVAAPLIDTSNVKFDFQAYNGKAVVLKTDGSVEAINIDEDSEEAQIKVGGSLVDMFSQQNKTFRESPKPSFPAGR